MRYCICASVCRLSTTNLRKHEEGNDETIWDCESAQDHVIRGVGRCRRHLGGDEPVELADDCGLWLARRQLLAGFGPAGIEPVAVRGLARRVWSWHALAPAHGRTLGANDAGGTRAISHRDARSLPPLRSDGN